MCFLPTCCVFLYLSFYLSIFLCTAAVENYLYAHHLVLPIHERIFGFKLLSLNVPGI